MVSLGNKQFSYTTLARIYRNTGVNPFTGENIDWSEVKQLNLQDSSFIRATPPAARVSSKKTVVPMKKRASTGKARRSRG